MVGVSIPHLGFNRFIPSMSFHKISFDAFVRFANAAAEWSEPPLVNSAIFPSSPSPSPPSAQEQEEEHEHEQVQEQESKSSKGDSEGEGEGEHRHNDEDFCLITAYLVGVCSVDASACAAGSQL